jgi:hypothetical protein
MFDMPNRNDVIRLLIAGVAVIGILVLTRSVGASGLVQFATIAAFLAAWVLVFGSRMPSAEPTANHGWLAKLRGLAGLPPRKN